MFSKPQIQRLLGVLLSLPMLLKSEGAQDTLSTFQDFDHCVQKQHFPAFSEPLIHFPLIIILTQDPPCYYSLLSCPKATECPWNAFAGRELGNNQFLINCTGRKTHWPQIDVTYSVESSSISWHKQQRSGEVWI